MVKAVVGKASLYWHTVKHLRYVQWHYRVGGAIRSAYYNRFPERVRQSFLRQIPEEVSCNPVGGLISWFERSHDGEQGMFRAEDILDTRFTPEWLAEHASDRALAEMMAARHDAPRSAEQRRGEAEQLAARRHHDVSARLSAVRCPTLVACGRYDGIAPSANSEWIASHIASAELRVYEGGHAFFIKDPHALPDVRSFVADR